MSLSRGEKERPRNAPCDVRKYGPRTSKTYALPGSGGFSFRTISTGKMRPSQSR